VGHVTDVSHGYMFVKYIFIQFELHK